MLRSLVCCLLLVIPTLGISAELTGQVVKVTDGDTITVLDAGKVQHKVRLLGIDAPEAKQAFGEVSRKHLAELVAGKEVRVVWKEKDRYGRILGDIHAGEMWANREMVAAGMAWHFTRYDKRTELADAEAIAREKRSGLWVEKLPVPPWEWRAATSSAK